MKKLITTDLGGHPVYFKDFEFLQEQIRELAKATFGHLDTTKVVVLNGCETTISTDGYTISVAEGWAFYANEFFYIPGNNATGSAPNVAKWRIVETWSPSGLKTFKDPAVGEKNVYKIRTLVVGYYPVISDGVLFSSSVIPERETEWATITGTSPWSASFRYRRNSLSQLELVGYCENGTKLVPVCIMPEGFRPISSYCGVGLFPAYSYRTGRVVILPNGELFIDVYESGSIVGINICTTIILKTT